MTESAETPATPLPTAIVTAPRRGVTGASWWWLVPIVAVLVAAWLGWSAWRVRGVIIEIQFPQAHGLKPGDPVRFRGVDIGAVRSLHIGGFGDDQGGVVVHVGLEQAADLVARGGSSFWLVRPEIGIDRISGLDAIVGARYIAVLPGDGPPQHRFIGLREEPVMIDALRPGDLEVVLEAAQRGSVVAGAPVAYRGVPVGVVTDITLAPDAAGVEFRVIIEAPFAPLVRERTRFWASRGIAFDADWLSGVSIELSSIATLLRGSLSMALPDEPGALAGHGARFQLLGEAPDGWESWRPRVMLGVPDLPPDWTAPRSERARLVWRGGSFFSGHGSRAGLVLQTTRGILAPRSLVEAPQSARPNSAGMEIGGLSMALERVVVAGEAALVPGDLPGTPAWPFERLRSATVPEDCMVLLDAGQSTLPLPAQRFTGDGDRWVLDPAIPIPPALHGAAVVAQRDGAVVGMLLAEPGRAAGVALLGPLLEASAAAR